MITKEEIRKLSKQLDIPEQKLEKILVEITQASLENVHCSFDNPSGLGPSDKS